MGFTTATAALKMTYDIPVLNTQLPVINITIKQEQEPEKKPRLYTIKQGDNLTKIAKENATTVERLWEANPDLKSPDLIEPNNQLKIPEPDEKLKDRPLLTQTPVKTPRYSSQGNTYEPGQCVWYVKNLRPELPNSWGSATTWLSRAQAMGWPTGSEPRVGAVGWTYGHVVLITAVNSDGSVSYTDMNGRWIPYEIGYGAKPASYYRYIY